MRWLTLVLIFLLLTCSNDEDCPEGYAPFDCNTSKPNYGKVSIKISINNLNQFVPIIIFNGNIEENKIVLTDTLESNRFYTLPNGYYSVKATYLHISYRDSIWIHPVDGGTLSPEEDEYCDATCYSEGTLTLNAELDIVP